MRVGGAALLLLIAVLGVTVACQIGYQQPFGVVATVSVDPQPVLAAVDERTAHAFIVNWNFGINGEPGVPSYAGTMTTLDAHNGSVLSKTAVGIYSLDMAVDTRVGRVFVANTDNSDEGGNPTARGSVSIFGTRSGALISRTVVGRVPSGLAIAERSGHVFVANQDGSTVSVLDVHSGHVVRTAKVGHGPSVVVVNEQTNRVFTANDATVSMLEASTGTVLRTISVSNGRVIVVNGRGGRVFVFNNDGVNLIDARDGSLLGTVNLSSSIVQAVIDEHTNRIFAVSQETNVGILLDAMTGKVLRTIKLGTHAGLAVVDRHNDRIFVGATDQSNHGVVDVLDASTGRMLGAIAVRGDPRAIDERAGRVFVLNGSGRVSLLNANVSFAASRRG